jgi:hypothetical protein
MVDGAVVLDRLDVLLLSCSLCLSVQQASGIVCFSDFQCRVRLYPSLVGLLVLGFVLVRFMVVALECRLSALAGIEIAGGGLTSRSSGARFLYLFDAAVALVVTLPVLPLVSPIRMSR